MRQIETIDETESLAKTTKTETETTETKTLGFVSGLVHP
jgi:hypothetical protein